MKTLLAAFALHQGSYSSKAFVSGPDGLLQPNVDRYERSPYVCFAEGDPPADPPAEKTYTQAEVNAINAKTAAKLESKLKGEFDEREKTLRAELDQMKVTIEETGKSAAERERLKAERERATVESKLGESEKSRADAEAKRVAAEQKLQATELRYELQGLAAAAKVLPTMTKAALLVFGAESTIERDKDGTVVGVDLVGGKRFGTIAEAFGEWMKTNGDGYVAAPASGAGTKASSGTTGVKNMGDMSASELAAAVNASESTASSGR